jgi:hypothetical protein
MYLQCPSTEEDWKRVASEFWIQWNFPNCLGALDGKHVVIRKPACSGSTYFNYKHSFSLILLALVDANYKFLFIDFGAQGRFSDGGVFAESDLNEAMQKNTINWPVSARLPDTEIQFPYCIVADDAFPLRDTIMKPYPHRNLSGSQRIFNYRLSRARRCVENAFGILAARFRFLLSPICLSPEKVDVLILAACNLHNMLRTVAPNHYVCRADETHETTGNRSSSGNKNQIPGAMVASRRSATKSAKQYRDSLCEFFNSPEGALIWQ